LPAGRGDQFVHGDGPDPQDTMKPVFAPRDMFLSTVISTGSRSRRGIFIGVGTVARTGLKCRE
jgi:hypothetical protein